MLAHVRSTVRRRVDLRGQGLHEGRDTRLVMLPAAAGEGIRFVRSDLEGRPAVGAWVAHREERPRRTALANGSAEVHTVEHLLAAVGGLGVTDLTVELDQVEVPGLDGSAQEFVRAIEEAGTVGLAGGVDRLVLDDEVEVSSGEGRIVARPCPGRLVLEYHLDYGADLEPARVSFEVTSEVFRREISPARTFCLEREALALKAAGLGKGANTQNTLVLGDDGLPIDNTLRFPDECARHKLLDLFGDLMLLGASLEAHVIAYRSGHLLNAELCRALRRRLDSADPRADSA